MKKCVHCFVESEEITKDHIFPKSWYTDNTPSHIQKLTVPSCLQCNGKFGRLEEELFPRLALCIDPQKFEASGITSKTLRSFGLGVEGLPLKEKEIREASLMKMIMEMSIFSKDKKKPFPGLGPHKGYPIEMQIAIPVPEQLLPVLGKIFRGLEYKLGGRYMENPYVLKIYHIFEEPEEIKKVLNYKVDVSFGPGFKVERITPPNMTEPVLYKTTIWGTLISYASVSRK